MIRAVLFDAGGTLLSPHPSVGHVYAAAGRPHGLSASPAALEMEFRARWPAHVARRGLGPIRMGLDDEATRDWWRAIVFPVLEALGFSGDREACFGAIFDAFATPSAWRIYEDVAPTLAGLEARGIRKGVLSNWDYRLGPLLEVLGLASRFDPILISALERVEKPDPEFFRRGLERLGMPAGEVLYVGDQEALDVAPALALGMSARLIDRRGERSSPYAIRRLQEILELP